MYEVACGFKEKCGVVDGKGWCVVWDSGDAVVFYTPRCRRLDRKRYRMQKKADAAKIVLQRFVCNLVY